MLLFIALFTAQDFFCKSRIFFAASLSETVPFTFVTNRDQTIFPLVLSFWCVAPESRIMYNTNETMIYMSADIHVIVSFVYCTLLKKRRFCSHQTKQEYTKDIKAHNYKYIYLQSYNKYSLWDCCLYQGRSRLSVLRQKFPSKLRSVWFRGTAASQALI